MHRIQDLPVKHLGSSHDCTESTQTPSGGSSANQINVNTNLGPATLIVVCVLAATIGACGVVMGLNLSKQAQMDDDFKKMKTQEWLLERRLMDKEALDLIDGKRLPSDAENGPTGNLQRMVPKTSNSK
jgi:hypothetical protein